MLAMHTAGLQRASAPSSGSNHHWPVVAALIVALGAYPLAFTSSVDVLHTWIGPQALGMGSDVAVIAAPEPAAFITVLALIVVVAHPHLSCLRG